MSYLVGLPFSEVPKVYGNGINPYEYPDEAFELYSVPSYESGKPEIVYGSQIGSNKQIVSEGMVLLCKINPRINRVWVVGPSSGLRQIASTEWIAFQASNSINSQYLAYFLRQTDIRDFLASNASGVGGSLMRVKATTLEAQEFRICGPQTQSRIVAKLEELLSDLDAGVAELKAAQTKLVQYRQSLLKAAVEGTLTAEWRAQQQRANDAQSHTPGTAHHSAPAETGAQLLARILTERRARWEEKQLARFAEKGQTPPKDWQKKYPEPVQPDTTDLPTLPEGWVWASVDMLSPSDLANGRSVPTGDSGAKVLRLTAVKNGRIDLDEYKFGNWSEHDAKQYFVEQGDILIVRGNGSLSLVGRAGLVDVAAQKVAYPDTMIRLRVLDSIAKPSWISAVWDSQLVRNHLELRARTSAGIYKISQPDIVSARIPVPPLEEQQQLLTLLRLKLFEIDNSVIELEVALKQSTAQRQNILRAAFAGQLVLQDPNDEPASVLLERIRAERAAQLPVKKTRGRKAKESA